MQNLSHTFASLGMDRFKELFECYSEFEDDPETYLIAVFWDSYLEMVQTAGLYKTNQDRWLGSIHLCLREDASLASCLRLLRLCSPLLLLLGITASSCTGSFQLIPAFRKGWITLRQENSTKLLQIRPSSNLLTKIKKVEVI